ncbi:MAG: metallophosphoesterase [Bacteroidota bacterium]
MKIACIGDLHGVNRWKAALDLSVDHYVFVGDFVDSHVFDDDTILKNFEDVLRLKKEHPSTVSLLLGNHDVQYMYHPDFRGSGFRPSMLDALRSLFGENETLFQIAYSYRSFVFTHAGLHRRWVDSHIGTFKGPSDLVRKLNAMLTEPSRRQRLGEIGLARGGRDAFGGPLWCDFDLELTVDPCPGIDQVVGHTQRKFLGRVDQSGNTLYNVNYLAYSLEPIFVLELN